MTDEPVELSPRSVFLLGFSFEIALVFVAAVIGLLVRGVPFPFQLSFDWEGLAWALGAALPMAASAVFNTSDIAQRIGPLRRIHDRVKSILGPAIREMSGLDLVLLSVAAGVGEEVLFRGVLQTVLGAHGLWVSSLLFGVLHALTFTYFVLAGLIGLYCGWLFQVTGNLLAPVLVHALYDIVALWRLQKRFRCESAREESASAEAEE